eukprot:TRINITY_DN7641_c0_g1_i1.p1 TRINITY_DN7641_c0_g1~~TRINITY_DN7641_c0_g1_i1.p1  ORF type:complete len:459 (-),score=91.57 TRINITY_DN7641_c0_g1_i1:10-1386(-)
MPSSFVEYEKKNNRFVKALQNSKELKDLAESLAHRAATLLVPQNVTLEDIEITQEFAAAHIALFNPQSKLKFATLNGIAGSISDRRDFLSVVSGPPAGSEPFEQPFKLHVLREAHVDIHGHGIPMILISDPVVYVDCAWASHQQIQAKPRVVQRPTTVAAAATPAAVALPQVNMNDFLDRLKDPRASQIATQLKSFIAGFAADEASSPDERARKAQMFMERLEAMIQSSPVWREGGEKALYNAGEAVEKYILSKVFTKAFVCDTEKDRQLHRKLAALQSIPPQNLDILPQLSELSFDLPIQELQRINSFKVPRDKLVCVLNCSKLLLNILSVANKAAVGADDFFPCLIYVVIRANPPNLPSNLKYITDYRAPERISSEVEYYYMQLFTAVAFLESATAEQLNMDPAIFQRLMSQHEPQHEYKWLNAEPADVRLGDLAELLKEYQRLARAEMASRDVGR